MTMVTLTVLLMFANGDFQAIETDEKFWSLEHCVASAEAAIPLVFDEIPNLEEIRYTCQEE